MASHSSLYIILITNFYLIDYNFMAVKLRKKQDRYPIIIHNKHKNSNYTAYHHKKTPYQKLNSSDTEAMFPNIPFIIL